MNFSRALEAGEGDEYILRPSFDWPPACFHSFDFCTPDLPHGVYPYRDETSS